MNVDASGAIADERDANSRIGAPPAGDEFEGVLRQTLGTEEADAERSSEALAEDGGRDESFREDLEAGEELEEEEAAAENLSEGVVVETRGSDSARIFTGEFGNVATVEQQALAVEAGAVQADGRGAPSETEEIPDETKPHNASALAGVAGEAGEAGASNILEEQPGIRDDSSGERGRAEERTESAQVAEESIARDQSVRETDVQSDAASSADKAEVASAPAELANEARSESPTANAEQNTLTLEGNGTGDRQEREPSEEARTASAADLSRENPSAEVRTESQNVAPEYADRAAAPGFSTGAEAASTNPVSTPLVAAPLAAEQVAAPGSSIPPPAADAVAVQTEWLVSRGGGSARLVLHPQELGEIAIRVTVRDGVVDVVMVAQESAAKAIAEQQGDRLTQAFANRDLRMENFEVRRGDAASLGNEGDPSFREPGGGQGQSEAGNDRQETASAETGNGLRRSNRAPVESVLPQIVSIAPAGGVDLRI